MPPFLLKTDDNADGVLQSLFDGVIAGVKTDRLAFLDDFFDDFFKNFYNTDTMKAHADLVPFSKWTASAASPLATRQCIVAFGTTDFRQDLKQVDVPALVVHGDEDRIVPIDIFGKKPHETIRGSRYEVVVGAPHGFAATQAARLNQLMLDFLRS